LTNEFYRLPNLRQNTILVRYSEEDRRNAQDLESLHLTTPDGRQVPLKSVAAITKESAPSAIEHDGLERVIGVTGYYRHGTLPSMDVAMDLVSKSYGGESKTRDQARQFSTGLRHGVPW
jgi:HAE1 family hydrophobic/amphiphilic exporter-1